MPWTKKSYPVSMKNLPADVRGKAIDIANALLEEEQMEEGIAIATGISRAKDWAANRGKKIKSANASARPTDAKRHGEDRYVTPHNDGWAVKKERAGRAQKIFERKADAISHARKDARDANAALTIQSKNGRVQKRISYNPNRRSAKTS